MSAIAGPVDDPLLRHGIAERLAFNDGGLLTAEQMQLEQLYHRARLGRLIAYLHGSGTVAGLDVAISADKTEVQVAPGLAIDRLGRLIELPALACLRLSPWFDQMIATPLGRARAEAARRNAVAAAPPNPARPEHVVADVYIQFLACRRVPEPAFATGNADDIDSVQASRILDAAKLSMMVRPTGDDRLPRETAFVAAGTPDAMRTAIRDGKRLRLWPALRLDGEPPRLPHGGAVTEHVLPDQDGTEVFLARLILPVARAASGALRLDSEQPVTVGQEARLYVYSAAELALFGGLAR